MAINLDNATFKMFTDFAATAKSASTRAQFESRIELNGEIRTIKPAGGLDFVGNILRLAKYKSANDTVRNLFSDTIEDMFGGADHVPESVQDAMKLEDYGRGKPLTARRILAVKQAIVSYKKIEDDAINTLGGFSAYKKLSKDDADSLHRTVRGILGSCKYPDEAKVLSAVIEKICMTGDGKFRSSGEMEAKANALKANFAELREAAKGNQSILKAGASMLELLGGKSLPQGQIGKLVAFATGKEVKMDVIRRLRADTGPVTIARALIQLEKNIQAALSSANIVFDVYEADNANPVRDFFATAMLQRLGDGKLGKIQQALTGEEAARLENLVETLESWRGKIPIAGLDDGQVNETIMGDAGTSVPEGLRDEIKSAMQGIVLHGKRTMSSIISVITGREVPDLPPNKEVPYNTLMILDDIKDVAKESLQRKKSHYIDQTVSGDGQKADLMRKLISDKIGDYSQIPSRAVLRDISEKTMESLNGKFAGEMNKIVGGGEGTAGLKTFAEIKIGGQALPGDVGKAKDGIAQFVSGGKAKDFASLQGADLRKAQMLLALISPESQKAIAEGFLAGLDGNRARELFDMDSLTPEMLARAGAKVDISMDESGNLTIKLDNTIPIKESAAATDLILPEPGADKRSVRLDLGFRLEIKPDEFERLAKAGDFTFDSKGVTLVPNFKADFDKKFNINIGNMPEDILRQMMEPHQEG